MRDRHRWSPDAQRFLDGDGPPPADAAEGERVRAFAGLVSDWADGLPRLDERLDRAIMAAVRGRPEAGPRGWWSWLMEPRRVALRPALAVATGVALMALTALITVALRGGAGAPAVPLTAGVAGGATILVRFELAAPDARRVALAGSFNDWSDSTIVFSRAPGRDVWTVTVALPPGRHQYLFVVDGERWIPDPAAHAQIEDEFGQRNSLLVVGPRGVVRS
jgi:hypothetical protein